MKFEEPDGKQIPFIDVKRKLSEPEQLNSSELEDVKTLDEVSVPIDFEVNQVPEMCRTMEGKPNSLSPGRGSPSKKVNFQSPLDEIQIVEPNMTSEDSWDDQKEQKHTKNSPTQPPREKVPKQKSPNQRRSGRSSPVVTFKQNKINM